MCSRKPAVRKGQAASAAAPDVSAAAPPVSAAAPRGPNGPAAVAAFTGPTAAGSGQSQPRPTLIVSAAAPRGPTGPAAAASGQLQPRRGGKNSKGSQKKQSNRQKLRDPKPRSKTYTVTDGDCNCQLQLRVRVDTAVNGVDSCLHSVVFNVEFPHQRLHNHVLGSSADRAAYHMIALSSGTSVAAEVGSAFSFKLTCLRFRRVVSTCRVVFTCHARDALSLSLFKCFLNAVCS